MAKITNVKGRQVFDSRGNPTVEAEVFLDNNISASAISPSGASTGAFEAYELRDQDKSNFLGKSVQKAVENTGQSVVEATFTTMGGVFSGVLISFFSSQFIGLRNFFALIITLVLFSLLMAVFALPSFYHALHYMIEKYKMSNWKIKKKFN